MGEWPEGWTHNGPAAPGPRSRPTDPADQPATGARRLPPELDPRGGRPRPTAPAAPGSTGRRRPAPPGSTDRRQPEPGGTGRRRRVPSARLAARLLLLLLVVVVVFYAVLGAWGTSRLERVAALSGRADTPGTTWLLVGSDSREGLTAEERRRLRTGRTEGRRTDTVILLHAPPGGEPTLVSLPRDSYVEIPGRGANKLNAAFSLGGPELLVATVERATGLTVDHYVEVGFGGIVGVVDGAGGVHVCVDRAIEDEKSGLDVPAGCQEMDGGTSLAYVRARYFDPTGDLGRIRRQQQFLGALVDRVFGPGVLLNPVRQVRLVGAGTDAVVVDEDTGPVGLGRLAWTFRAVTGGGGVVTTVPVADPDYRPGGGVGSTVRWDEDAAAELFADLEAGRPVPEPSAG